MSEIEHRVFLHLNAKNFSRNNIITNPDFYENGNGNTDSKYIGLDLFRGFLLIFVVTYHAIGGKIHDDQLSFWILTFTMPMFTALSGYIINEEYIKESDYLVIAEKYWRRMIKDWLVVWSIMYTIDAILGLVEPGFISFIYYLIFPKYHLWWVPALFLFVSIFWLVKHFNISDRVILISSIVFSMVYGLYSEYYIVPTRWNILYDIPYGIYYSLKPNYLGFFILGWYLRKYKTENKTPRHYYIKYFLILVTIIFLIGRVNLSFDFLAFYTIDFYILNYSLTILLFPVIRHIVMHKNMFFSNFLHWLSEYSLYVYLYHGLFVYVRYF